MTALQLASGPVELGVVRAMADGRAHLMHEMVDAVYRGVRNPPLCADDCVRRAIYALRRKGYQIECVRRGCYRLLAQPMLVLHPLRPPTPPAPIAPDVTQRLAAFAARHDATLGELRGRARYTRLVRLRWLAMEMLRRDGMGSAQIAASLGLKDHTTVLHGLRQMALLRQLGLDDEVILRGDGPRGYERRAA